MPVWMRQTNSNSFKSQGTVNSVPMPPFNQRTNSLSCMVSSKRILIQARAKEVSGPSRFSNIGGWIRRSRSPSPAPPCPHPWKCQTKTNKMLLTLRWQMRNWCYSSSKLRNAKLFPFFCDTTSADNSIYFFRPDWVVEHRQNKSLATSSAKRHWALWDNGTLFLHRTGSRKNLLMIIIRMRQSTMKRDNSLLDYTHTPMKAFPLSAHEFQFPAMQIISEDLNNFRFFKVIPRKQGVSDWPSWPSKTKPLFCCFSCSCSLVSSGGSRFIRNKTKQKVPMNQISS